MRDALVLRVFFGYQIESEHHRSGDFRRVARKLRDEMRAQVRIDPEFGEFDPGAKTWEEVEAAIEKADVVVVDISENNPNVLLEAGVAFGMQKLVILLRATSSDEKLPSDLSAFLHIPYSKFDYLDLAIKISRGIKSYLSKPKDSYFYIRHLWGLQPSSRTYVLPGRLPPEYGVNTIENYVKLREYTDLDALFLIVQTLGRLYPHMTVLVHHGNSTRELPDDWRDANIICIGGPDYNKISKEFDRNCPLEYCYKNDSVWLKKKNAGTKYVPRFTERGGLERVDDYGFFMKSRLGRDPHRRLVMIGGALTWGVYGAAMLFGCRGFAGDSLAVGNAKLVVKALGSDPRFVALVKVGGSVNGVDAPCLRARDITPMPHNI